MKYEYTFALGYDTAQLATNMTELGKDGFRYCQRFENLSINGKFVFVILMEKSITDVPTNNFRVNPSCFAGKN